MLKTPIVGLLTDIALTGSRLLDKSRGCPAENSFLRLRDLIARVYFSGDDQNMIRRGLVKLIRLYGSAARTSPDAYASLVCDDDFDAKLNELISSGLSKTNTDLIRRIPTSSFERAKDLSLLKANRASGGIWFHLGTSAYALSNIGILASAFGAIGLTTDRAVNGNFDLRESPPKSSNITYVCGVDNRDPYFSEQLDTLKHLFPDSSISGLLNRSNGMFLDLLELSTLSLFPKHSSSTDMIDSLTNHLRERISSGKPTVVIGHSSGAIVVREAIRGLSREERASLGVVLVGSVAQKGDYPTVVNVNPIEGDPFAWIPHSGELYGVELRLTNSERGLSLAPGHLMRSYLRRDPEKRVETLIRKGIRGD